MIKRYRVNERIFAREVRLISETGEQLGVMPVAKALELARERDYDLVDVAPTSAPPVCRLLDWGKFKYEQTKKEHEARKKQKAVFLREVRLRPKIGKHDIEFKIRIIKKLIDEGDKVKVRVLFRGREITHPELGRELLESVAKELEGIATVEAVPAMDVRSMNMILAPTKEPKSTEKVTDA
ncbi:MAG: translation initiation factor IF-3 [Dehalococcoidia bacterium]|nr:translation initiation factor IF-3 [Dehalococcoidia bacterium]